MVVDVIDEALDDILQYEMNYFACPCGECAQERHIAILKIRKVFEHQKGWFTVDWPNQ